MLTPSADDVFLNYIATRTEMWRSLSGLSLADLSHNDKAQFPYLLRLFQVCTVKYLSFCAAMSFILHVARIHPYMLRLPLFLLISLR